MSENSGKFVTLNNNQHCSFQNANSENENYLEMSERELNTFDKFVYNSVNLNQIENDKNFDVIYVNRDHNTNKNQNINYRYEKEDELKLENNNNINYDEFNNQQFGKNLNVNETETHSFKIKENLMKNDYDKFENTNYNNESNKNYISSNFKQSNSNGTMYGKNGSYRNYKEKDHLLFKLNGLNEVMEKNKEVLLAKYKLKEVYQREHDKSQNIKNNINIINAEIERIKSENEAMIFAKFNEDLDRNNLQESQKKITVYCNDMKRKSMNVEKTYEDYENLIKQRQNENVEIENEYRNYIARAGKI